MLSKRLQTRSTFLLNGNTGRSRGQQMKQSFPLKRNTLRRIPHFSFLPKWPECYWTIWIITLEPFSFIKCAVCWLPNTENPVLSICRNILTVLWKALKCVLFHLAENSSPVYHRNGQHSRFSWDGSSIETVNANNLNSQIQTGWRQARTTPLAESGVTWTRVLPGSWNPYFRTT